MKSPAYLAVSWALLALTARESPAAALAPWLRAAAERESVEVFVLLHAGDYEASEPRLQADALRRRTAVRAALTRTGAVIEREMGALPAFVVRADAGGLDAIASLPEVRAVDGIQYGGGALAESVPRIGADRLHGWGLRGEGAVVAVVDTGVDAEHEDVSGRVEQEECICVRCCEGGSDRASGPGSAMSRSAHGPHVAGIVASGGTIAPEGVAPAARIVAIRVLNDTNRGSLVDWVAALDLILAAHPEVAAVNMSLVSDIHYEPDCDRANAFTMAFSDLVTRLRRRGTIVVAAAGNTQTIGALPAPACVSGVVAVGAVTKADEIASFSNAAEKLALLAPGVAILSDAPGDDTAWLTGTSMAAPHVTGSLALLLPLVGRPFAASLPDVLRHTGVPIADPRTCGDGGCQTFPRLDAGAAADWLGSIGDMCTGGGSRVVDCQVEWLVGGMSRQLYGRGGRYRCRDGDPSCDADSVRGQCTFRLQGCFNVPDVRLTTCDPLQSIDAYRLIVPRLGGSEPDLQNAIALLASLPTTPIREAGKCGGEFAFVVPAGRMRTLRFAAESLRGRDIDRLRFACRPGPPAPVE